MCGWPAGDGAGAFKEHEGTGMGEGQGAKDVSDKIENEDQLQGAQQKDEEERQVSPSTICGLTTPNPPPLPPLTWLGLIAQSIKLRGLCCSSSSSCILRGAAIRLLACCTDIQQQPAAAAVLDKCRCT